MPSSAIAKRICAHLETGIPITLAADAEGIERSIIFDWLNRRPEFSGQVTRARARGTASLIRKSLSSDSEMEF
jgi:hypothetical protein